MKATMSKDGHYRVDIRVTFRVNIGDLAAFLCSSLNHVEIERLSDILDGLSARQIRDRIRKEMEEVGLNALHSWSEQFGYTETTDRLFLAESAVRRAYPELDKTQPTPSTDANEEPKARYVVEPVRLGFAVVDTETGKPVARMGSRYAAIDMAARLELNGE